jgi:hypothetical protein
MANTHIKRPAHFIDTEFMENNVIYLDATDDLSDETAVQEWIECASLIVDRLKVEYAQRLARGWRIDRAPRIPDVSKNGVPKLSDISTQAIARKLSSGILDNLDAYPQQLRVLDNVREEFKKDILQRVYVHIARNFTLISPH